MTHPQTRVVEPAPTRTASGPACTAGPLAPNPGEVTGLDGYAAVGDFHLWFRSYPDRPAQRGGPTHSVHIARPNGQPGRYSLAELWQGPLTKLIKDAVTGGYMVKAADVEPVGQLELFAGVSA